MLLSDGPYGFRHDTAYKPYVMLINTDRKLIVITYEEWKRMLLFFEDVTVCLNNKETKTILVTGEDCVAFGFTA